MTKLLNLLGDHVVISGVHGMFAVRKTFWNVTQKNCRDLNEVNNSPILDVSIVSFYARI